MDLREIKEIRPYAFAGCTILTTAIDAHFSPNWTVRLPDQDIGDNVSYDYIFMFLDDLTDTYSGYYWSKQ